MPAHVHQSKVLKRLSGRYCWECRIFYDQPEVLTCRTCGHPTFERVCFRRIETEIIAAVALWGLLTAGIAWAVLWVLSVLFQRPMVTFTRYYWPDDPNEEVIPTTSFSKSEFFGFVFSLPVIVLALVLFLVVAILFGGLIAGLLKSGL